MSLLDRAAKIGNKLTGGLLFDDGSDNAAASTEAGRIQFESTQKGIEESRLARGQVREDLAPFRESGAEGLTGLSSLITDPNEQQNFISNNPLLAMLNQNTSSRLSNIGSNANTADQLNENLALYAPDLIQGQITNKTNLTKLGLNAAAKQATQTLNSSGNITDLITQGGNAQAAGIVGAQNAESQARDQNVATLSAILQG